MKLALLALPILVAFGSAALAGNEGSGGAASVPSACSADVQKYCPSSANDADRKSCLETNRDKVAEACRTAMAGSGDSEDEPHGY
jgi:hypothetical protein